MRKYHSMHESFMIGIIGIQAPTSSGSSLKLLDYAIDDCIKKPIFYNQE